MNKQLEEQATPYRDEAEQRHAGQMFWEVASKCRDIAILPGTLPAIVEAMLTYASNRISPLLERIEELERENALHVKGKNVMGIMHDDCVKEIERLKGLVEKVVKEADRNDSFERGIEAHDRDGFAEEAWNNFKISNNL